MSKVRDFVVCMRIYIAVINGEYFIDIHNVYFKQVGAYTFYRYKLYCVKNAWFYRFKKIPFGEKIIKLLDVK